MIAIPYAAVAKGNVEKRLTCKLLELPKTKDSDGETADLGWGVGRNTRQ